MPSDLLVSRTTDAIGPDVRGVYSYVGIDANGYPYYVRTTDTYGTTPYWLRLVFAAPCTTWGFTDTDPSEPGSANQIFVAWDSHAPDTPYLGAYRNVSPAYGLLNVAAIATDYDEGTLEIVYELAVEITGETFTEPAGAPQYDEGELTVEYELSMELDFERMVPPGQDGGTVLVLTQEGRWNLLDMRIDCFGQYQQQTGGVIDDLTDEINDYTQPIDQLSGSTGRLESIVGTGFRSFIPDSGGTDAGADFSGSFDVVTDLSPKGSPDLFKRVLSVRLYLRNEHGGTVSVAAQADERDWYDVGAADLDAGLDSDLVIVDLPCDVRARHFRFRVTASNAFRFLGMILQFVPDGEL
jgi:hypothetical protein